jgi:hypothetical protein
MQVTERQQILLDIFEHAQNSKPTEFRILTNFAEYRFCKSRTRYTKLIIRALQSGADSLFKKYCKAVITSEADFTKLLAYKQTIQIISFYEQELKTLYDMLEEYEEYLYAGNFLTALIGEPRTGADLLDFRKYR